MLFESKNFGMNVEGIQFVLSSCHAQGSHSWRSQGEESRVFWLALLIVLGTLVYFILVSPSLPSTRRCPSYLLAVERGVLYGTLLVFDPKRNAPF